MLLEQLPFELPVGASPPLRDVSTREGPRNIEGFLPGVAAKVHRWKRHATILDLQERLVLEIQLTNSTRRYCLREAFNGIVCDLSSAMDAGSKAGCNCKMECCCDLHSVVGYL